MAWSNITLKDINNEMGTEANNKQHQSVVKGANNEWAGNLLQ